MRCCNWVSQAAFLKVTFELPHDTCGIYIIIY